MPGAFMRKMSAATKKKTIFSTLPKGLRKPLSKPRLKKLTFCDVATVEKQLLKYFSRDQSQYMISACGACGGWP